MVRLTGVTITTYVQTWIAWTYILLANNFAALNAQISGGTQANQETRSYQTQVFARLVANEMAFEQSLSSTESPDHRFQATVASVSGGADATRRVNSTAIMRDNTNWLRGLKDVSAAGDAANAIATFQYQVSQYCTEAQQELGLCTITDSDLSNAHRDAGTVFDYKVLSEKFRDASIDFCRTMVGTPPGQNTSSDYTSPEGAVLRLNRDTHDARMGLVLKACEHIISIRADIPDGEIASWAQTMRQLITGVGGGVPAELSDISPEAVGSSLYEIMSFAAKYRISNPEWYAHTATMPHATPVLKQLAAIRATRLFLRFQRYEMQQINAGLIATIQGAESNQYFNQKVGDISQARF